LRQQPESEQKRDSITPTAGVTPDDGALVYDPPSLVRSFGANEKGSPEAK